MTVPGVQGPRSPLRRAVSAALSPRRALQRLNAPEELAGYAASRSSAPPAFLRAVQEGTLEASPDAHMMVAPDQGELLACLVHATAARLVLEIGTFTGYSTLAMARALPPGGRIITCEVDPDSARAAAGHFERSPYADRIQLEVGPAVDTLQRLDGPFDLVLVDADKEGYAGYFEAVLPKLGDHGLIVVDNTLYMGLHLGDEGDTAPARAVSAFNDALLADPRVEQVVLPLWDGMTVIRPVRQPGGDAVPQRSAR